jgi:hypothetical protein
MTRQIPAKPAELDDARVIERPDGFYWQALEDRREHGPFATLVDAVADMQAGGEADDDDPDDLREVEDALGVPEWTDPATGQLADDEWTRTEEH